MDCAPYGFNLIVANEPLQERALENALARLQLHQGNGGTTPSATSGQGTPAFAGAGDECRVDPPTNLGLGRPNFVLCESVGLVIVTGR